MASDPRWSPDDTGPPAHTHPRRIAADAGNGANAYTPIPHAASSFVAGSSLPSPPPSSSLSSLSPLPSARESWSISASEVVINPRGLVGEGYFGVVYQARWREMTVCAKKLKNVRGGELSNFTAEVQLCTQLRHPHLVQFLAACAEPRHLCIITEWMSGGSLYSFLHERSVVGGVRYSRTDYATLLRIASEIAKALIYLHAARVTHRDLTTANILLDSRLTAKVGDFGLSRPSHESGSGVATGNLLYIAPEAFLMQQFTSAADCFSFGVILNEMMTGVPPFKGVAPALAASEVANRGARPNLSASTPVGIVRLIVQCWAHDPTQRPSMRQVLQTIEELAEEMAADMRETEVIAPTAIPVSRTPPIPIGNGSGGATHGRNSNGDDRDDPDRTDDRRRSKSKRVTSDGTSAPSSGASTPSRSQKTRSARASPPVPTTTPTALDSYDRPHTPVSEDDDRDASTAAYTPDSFLTGSPPVSAPVASAAAVAPVPLLISPDPAVTPRDIRQLLACLKRHTPQCDAYVLHKPTLSAIDIFCDPTNAKKYAGNAPAARMHTTAAVTNDDALRATTPFRSRSEGDNDGDDPPKPRTHACSPAFVSSMYSAQMPVVGELVVCRAKRCDDLGAMYDLCEYTQPQVSGMAHIQELTKRRMRSVAKIVPVGQLDVLRVLHVDVAKGFVDLSKKDVSDQLRTTTLTFFRQAEAAHACIIAAARALGACSYCLYFHAIRPLAARYESSVYQLLRLSLVAPVMTFGEFRECACMQRHHTAIATTSGATSHTHILSTPRVLPEIARRCEYHRVHLSLCRLALNALPAQLCDEPTTPIIPLDQETSFEDGDPPARRKGSRSSSTSGSRRSSSTSTSGPAKSASLISSLRSLNLEENPLRSLSDRIGAYRKLHELNVNTCDLDDLPAALGECAGMRRLYAFGNRFTRIPHVLRRLTQLIQLNLAGNRIAALATADLSGLTQLRELSLAHNHLSSIETGTLPTSLQTIDLSANRLVHFPNALFELTSIVSMEIKNNQIDSIPAPTLIGAGDASPLAYLEWLDASQNCIAHVADRFFDGCTYVSWVNFSQNHLTTLPDSLFGLIRPVEPKELTTHTHELETRVSMSTDGHTDTTSSPVGLIYLNLQSNRLRACTTVERWQQLTTIPQLLFDTQAMPTSNPPAVATRVVATITGTTSSLPLTPQLLSVPVVVSPAMHTWSVDAVAEWLCSEGLEQFAPAFLENLITGATLLELDKSDLLDLGVKQLGTQKKILKMIQTQLQKEQALAAKATSATPTPNSVSLHASPFPTAQMPQSVDLSSLSLGPRALDGGAPPSVAIRRANSATSLATTAGASFGPPGGIVTSTIGAGASTGCDLRTCERVRSAVLRAAVSSEALCRPVLLRCVVVLLIGTVHTTDEARARLDAAVAAGRAAAAGGVAAAAFRGLSPGARSHLSIAPLLLPLYLLSVPCLLPSEGIALIEAAIGAMSSALFDFGDGGRAKVCIRPYVVDVLPTQTLEFAPPPVQIDTGGGHLISAGSSPLTASMVPNLARSKSATAPPAVFSGEILAAFDMFQASKRDTAAAAAEGDAPKRKKEKKEGSATNSDRKKKKKQDMRELD